MKKNANIIFLIIIPVFIYGCVDSEPIKIIDFTSGFYYLYGSISTVENDCIHCPIGQDTLESHVNFSIVVKRDRINTEQIQFFGLYGADTGDFDKRVFPDCTRSTDCEIFGTIRSGGLFEIDIDKNGRRYQASGSIRKSDFDDGKDYWIELYGKYSTGDITIDYDLRGKKISLKLD